MTRPTEAHAQAAKRLLVRENASVGGAEERAAAAGRAYETLFQAFAPVIGAAGVRALFARSVKLTKAELPWLAELPLGGDVPVEEQLVGLSKLEPGAALTAATTLYASLLALMTTFIGEQLVWRILQGALPAIDETGVEETE